MKLRRKAGTLADHLSVVEVRAAEHVGSRGSRADQVGQALEEDGRGSGCPQLHQLHPATGARTGIVPATDHHFPFMSAAVANDAPVPVLVALFANPLDAQCMERVAWSSPIPLMSSSL